MGSRHDGATGSRGGLEPAIPGPMAAVGGEDRETELELLAWTPGPPWKANSAFKQFVTSSRIIPGMIERIFA